MPKKKEDPIVIEQSKLVDYLMTYGWAILIIVVIIGALWKMGVFTSTTKEDFASSCENLCRNENLEYKGFSDDRTSDGLGCVVCDCYKGIKRIPIVCSD